MGQFKKLRQQENRLKFDMLINLDEQKAIQEKRQAKKQKKQILEECIKNYTYEKKEIEVKAVPLIKTIEKPLVLNVKVKQNNKTDIQHQKNIIKELKRKYCTVVRKLTKQVDKTQIEGYCSHLIYNHKRDGSMVKALNRLIIDHKIPLSYGYKNGVKPERIADISNLQYLTVKENMIKGMKPLIDDLNRWIIE